MGAFGLPRQTEEFLVAGEFALTDRGDMLILIAEKQNLSETAFRMLLHDGHPIGHRSFEVEFQHHTEGLGEARVYGDREIQGADTAILCPPREVFGAISQDLLGEGVHAACRFSRADRTRSS